MSEHAELWIELIESGPGNWRWIVSRRETYAGRHLGAWGATAKTAQRALADALARREALIQGKED